MKTNTLLFIFFVTVWSSVVVAQADITYDVRNVEVAPKFAGGPITYLNEMELAMKGHNKKVWKIDWISFTVEKDGTLTDIVASNENERFSESENALLEKVSQKWQPAMVKGKAVRCRAYASRYPVKILADETIKGDDQTTDIPLELVTDGDDANDHIYNSAGIDIKPEFPEGSQKFTDFFNTHFKLPDGLEDVSFKIILTFVVEKDGSLSDIKVLRDIGHETKEEAIRVVKLSPKWTPGQQNGKIVRVSYFASVLIRVQ